MAGGRYHWRSVGVADDCSGLDVYKRQEKQRAAVLMHKYEEMEYSQIARALDCSESAVKSLLFRAYETLRARLAHRCV